MLALQQQQQQQQQQQLGQPNNLKENGFFKRVTVNVQYFAMFFRVEAFFVVIISLKLI
jgi:hypothetical protein